MNFIQEYKIYRKIITTKPVNITVSDAPISGIYARHWIVAGLQIYSVYERKTGYSTEIQLDDGRIIDLDGWLARKVFEHIQRAI